MNKFDLLIIGGGPAGCMAAISAAEAGLSGEKILIIERNDRLLRKLGITGKGRCNITNNCDLTEFIKNLPVNGRFMYSAFSEFGSSDTMDFFEKLGVPLKTERGNRVFPVSDKALDIVDAFKKRVKSLGIKTSSDRIIDFEICDNKVVGVKGEKSLYHGKNVILATGGKSYSKTGSTGDGYKLAEKLGHTIIPLKPSLVPVITEESCAEMAGLSLKNVTLSLLEKGGKKPLFKEMGEMLFTHTGVSGPLVLSASSYIKLGKDYYIELDLKPALDEVKLDARLLREFEELKNKQISNAVRRLLPESLIKMFLEKAKISPEKQVNEINRAERQNIIQVLKHFRLTVIGLEDIEQAIITDGGVLVKEIEPNTMKSKLIENLYFAGEIIDVTGFTGGFNLQIALSTGFLAGKNGG